MYEATSVETAKLVRDLSSRRSKLEPISAQMKSADIVHRFCETKQIAIPDLADIGTLYRLAGKGPDVVLAWSWTNADGVPVAIKYRNLATGKRWAETSSSFKAAIPVIAGNRASMDWIVLESETDAARVLGLTERRAGILLTPNAKTVLPQHMAHIPRGARVYAAQDHDEPDKNGVRAGELGAEKVIRLVPGAVRLSPAPYNDWCEWQGGPEEFSELAREASSRGKKQGGLYSFGEVLEEIQNEPEPPGLETPMQLYKVVPGRLYILGGYTGDGKTSYAGQFPIELASAGKRTLFVSLEMGRRDIVKRLAATAAGVAFDSVTPEQLEDMYDWPISVTDDPGIQDLRPYLDEHGPFDLVIMDHLHQMAYLDRMAINQHVINAKSVAVNYHVPVLLLAQLSRRWDADARTFAPRPALSQFKESSAIEQLADMAIFVWRERNEADAMTDEAEIIIAKDRFGPFPRSYKVRFQGECTRFVPRGQVQRAPTQSDWDALEEPERGWYR